MKKMDSWLALYTKSNFERKIVKQLGGMNIEAYCPTFKTLKQYSDRKKKVEKVLLPNYVFIKSGFEKKESVFSIYGVLRYVNWLGKPVKINSVEIDQMKYHLNNYYEDFSLDKIDLNSNYKVKSGPFKGFLGTVVGVNKNNIRLILKSLGVVLILKRF